MGQTNQIFTVPYRCISICGTSHSFSTCLWSPTVNFQQINIFNGIGIGLCCLNRHRCRVSNYMSKCKRLPSTEWSRFEGTMSFSLAAGFASWFQTRGRSSLVSLTSNVTFGHRSVATYRGPICQCQQKYMHKHTHTFPFVVSRHNGESSLQWTTLKKKKKADLSSSALPSSFLSPGQSSTTLPGHLPTGLFPSPARTRSLQSACPLPIRHCSAICETAFHWEQLTWLVEDEAKNLHI